MLTNEIPLHLLEPKMACETFSSHARLVNVNPGHDSAMSGRLAFLRDFHLPSLARFWRVVFTLVGAMAMRLPDKMSAGDEDEQCQQRAAVVAQKTRFPAPRKEAVKVVVPSVEHPH